MPSASPWALATPRNSSHNLLHSSKAAADSRVNRDPTTVVAVVRVDAAVALLSLALPVGINAKQNWAPEPTNELEAPPHTHTHNLLLGRFLPVIYYRATPHNWLAQAAPTCTRVRILIVLVYRIPVGKTPKQV